MKSTKLIATLLALVMVLSCMLMACSVADESSSSDASTAAPEQSGSSKTDETPAPGGNDGNDGNGGAETPDPGENGGNDGNDGNGGAETPDPGENGGNGEPDVDPDTLELIVEPTEMSFAASEMETEDLLWMGVEANIEDAEVIVVSDDGFDASVEGVYNIVYKATYFGVEKTGYRTITITTALSNITMEAQKNGMAPEKWDKTTISLAHKEYHELTSQPAEMYQTQSGIFHNKSAEEITISVNGGYGVAAICDRNGMVIEGRDGATGRLMNQENPIRTNGSKELPNGDPVTTSFAKEMKIPAGGFAIVLQGGRLGTTADSDGRNFMNYSVISKYGLFVRVFWQDTQEDLTEYLDQAPTVSGNTVDMTVKQNSIFDLNTMIWNNLTITDDNGTFNLSDDITYGVGESGLSVEVVDDGNFNIANVGTYTISLKVTDANGNEYLFERKVVVTAEALITLTFCGQTWQLGESKVGMNQQLDTSTKDDAYDILVYDKEHISYLSTSVLKVPAHAVYLRVNQYGEVVEIYDAPDGGRYTLPSDADTWGVHKAETWQGNNVAGQVRDAAANSLADGDILVVAVCHNACSGAFTAHVDGDLTKTFLAARSQKDGSKWVLTMTGMTFETKPATPEGE